MPVLIYSVITSSKSEELLSVLILIFIKKYVLLECFKMKFYFVLNTEAFYVLYCFVVVLLVWYLHFK